MKNRLANTIRMLFIMIFLWIAVTVTIQRFKCTKMSETELFLEIPNNFVLKFKY